MAKQEAIDFVLLDSQFEVDQDGYFSGGAHYQIINIPSDGILIQGYLEMKKEKAIALVSDVTDGYLTAIDDTIYVSVSGSLDGNALPDTFTLNYRLFKAWDSVEASPSLPASFGAQNLSVSPKGLLGGKKWKCAGNKELLSVMVHNDDGDFRISSNLQIGKAAGTDVGIVAEHHTDGVTHQHLIFNTPSVSIKNQYATGAEKLKSRYRFFKPEKWTTLNKFNPLEVTRV